MFCKLAAREYLHRYIAPIRKLALALATEINMDEDGSVLVGLSGRHIAMAVVTVTLLTYLWMGVIPLHEGVDGDENY